MRAAPDIFDFVTGRDGKNDAAIGHFDNSCLGRDLLSDRCWRDMAHIDNSADSALILVQEWPYGVQGGVLHHQDHDRRCQDRRKQRALELTGEVFLPYDKAGLPCRSDWNVAHVIVPGGAPVTVAAMD